MSDDSLVAALARAQAEFPPIQKNHTNPHFRSRYADLSDVLGAVRPVLAKHGIAVVQQCRWSGDQYELVTALLFGKDRIESCLPFPVDAKPQDMGSRLTYLRRYALAALVGVAAEDDDDGNAAQTAQPARKKVQATVTETKAPRNTDAPMPDGEALSFDQLVRIREHFDQMPDEVRKARKKLFVAQFGDPQHIQADAWQQVEQFMASEPF